MRRRLARLSLVLLSMGRIPTLWAQDVPAPARQWSGYSFASGRYAGGRAMTVIAGAHAGPVIVVAGASGKPRAHHWTAMGGLGTHLRIGSTMGVTSFLVVTSAQAGQAVILYALPRVVFGAGSFDGVISVREPLSDGVRRELRLNPVAVMMTVTHGVRAGLGAALTAAEGSAVQAGAGPLLAVRFPGGVFTGGVFLYRGRTEARLGYGVRF